MRKYLLVSLATFGVFSLSILSPNAAQESKQEKSRAKSWDFSPAYVERVSKEAELRRARLAKAQAEVVATPQSAEAHFTLAEAFCEDPPNTVRNNYDIIANEYRLAIKLNPGYAVAYHKLANLYGLMNDFEKQFAAYDKAISLAPANAEVHCDLGFAHLWDNIAKSSLYPDFTYELRLAAQAFQRAIQLKPDYAEAYRGLGETNYYRRKYKEAAEAYKRAVELEPKSVPAHEALGRAYIELGQKAEAMAAYDALVRLGKEADDETLRFVSETSASVLLEEIERKLGKK
jgi:tetratricopeptide (TPR) repeat protein